MKAVEMKFKQSEWVNFLVLKFQLWIPSSYLMSQETSQRNNILDEFESLTAWKTWKFLILKRSTSEAFKTFDSKASFGWFKIKRLSGSNWSRVASCRKEETLASGEQFDHFWMILPFKW